MHRLRKDRVFSEHQQIQEDLFAGMSPESPSPTETKVAKAADYGMSKLRGETSPHLSRSQIPALVFAGLPSKRPPTTATRTGRCFGRSTDHPGTNLRCLRSTARAWQSTTLVLAALH
jgi:hypothetical protein